MKLAFYGVGASWTTSRPEHESVHDGGVMGQCFVWCDVSESTIWTVMWPDGMNLEHVLIKADISDVCPFPLMTSWTKSTLMVVSFRHDGGLRNIEPRWVWAPCASRAQKCRAFQNNYFGEYFFCDSLCVLTWCDDLDTCNTFDSGICRCRLWTGS